MKKGVLLSAVLAVGLVGVANSATFKVSEDTYANFGVRLQVLTQHLGKRTTEDKGDLKFSIPSASVYFGGQVNRFVYFGANFETAVEPNFSEKNSTRPHDAYMGIRLGELLGLKDNLNVQVGLQRLITSREYLTDNYSRIIPTGTFYSLDEHGVPALYRGLGEVADYGENRGIGLTVWGDLGDGMIKYYIGAFDADDEVQGVGIPKTTYGFRVQFTPTMLGFKGEKGYTLADTYLGAKNVLSVGVGVAMQDYRGGKTAREIAVDAMYEQKFGRVVPNLQVGFKKVDNYGGVRDHDGKAYWVQGQVLYDELVGIGRPALALRYAKNDPDRSWSRKDSQVYGMHVNYYIKGHDAKISFGVDRVNVSNKEVGEKNFTDFTVAFQVRF